MGIGSLFSTPAHSFVNRPSWREFQTVLADLRRECTPALPVIVRASWLPETILGQCLRRDKRFVVQLNRDLGEPQAVRTATLVRPATTRARTASRAASGVFIPAIRTTARASTSTRSPKIASHFASQPESTPCFPE